MDGDGRADAVQLSDLGVLVLQTNGSQFYGGNFWINEEYLGSEATAFTDVTGDGAADLVAVDADVITVRRAESSTTGRRPDHFGARLVWYTGAFAGPGGVSFADVDGDGKSDAIAIDLDGIRVRRSTGTAFGPEEHWLAQRFYGTLGTFPQAAP